MGRLRGIHLHRLAGGRPRGLGFREKDQPVPTVSIREIEFPLRVGDPVSLERVPELGEFVEELRVAHPQPANWPRLRAIPRHVADEMDDHITLADLALQRVQEIPEALGKLFLGDDVVRRAEPPEGLRQDVAIRGEPAQRRGIGLVELVRDRGQENEHDRPAAPLRVAHLHASALVTFASAAGIRLPK